MSEPHFYVEARWGGGEDEPSPERMREIVAELATRDEEHPDAWLVHSPSEWSLRLDEDRLAYLEDHEGNTVAHMTEVGPDQALRLWSLFSIGGRESVSGEAWVEGAPPVSAEEIQAREDRARQLVLSSDRRFYDQLGAERPAVPCRSGGCLRGSITGSVFCRSHHFEQVYRRACPFNN